MVKSNSMFVCRGELSLPDHRCTETCSWLQVSSILALASELAVSDATEALGDGALEAQEDEACCP